MILLCVNHTVYIHFDTLCTHIIPPFPRITCYGGMDVLLFQKGIFYDCALLWPRFTWWSPQRIQASWWLDETLQLPRGASPYWRYGIWFGSSLRRFICLQRPLLGNASCFLFHGECSMKIIRTDRISGCIILLTRFLVIECTWICRSQSGQLSH